MSEGRRPPLRRLRHWLRPKLSRGLLSVAGRLLPALYIAYMRLVWATSRIDPGNFEDLKRIAAEYGGAVGLLWHEEVFTVAFAYPALGFSPHTLASPSRSGDLITMGLERCGYTVFRGGSSNRRSRRREGVLEDMVEHMRSRDDVIYGITVDGSRGPAYRMKPGGILIARDCGRPLALARTWYRRCWRLRTWDRTAIPLPFNRIAYYLDGPYFVPEDADTPEGLERFRLELEGALIDLAARSYDEMGQPRPAHLVRAPVSEVP